MKFKVFLFIILLFSRQSFSSELIYEAKEHFDTDTGSLHWDLGSEVRVKFIPSHIVSEYEDDKIYNFINAIDYFNILDKYPKKAVFLYKRGIRYEYLLTKDRTFPEEFEIRIGDPDHATRIQMILSRSDYEKETLIYDSFHDALNKNQVDIAAKISIGPSYSQTNKKFLLNISNLDSAENIREKIARKEVAENDELLHGKYLKILAINIPLVIILLWLLYVYKVKIHRCFVGFLGRFSKNTRDSISGYLHRPRGRSQIIKNENMKSYSVADELLKWSKLNEDGLISDDEFKIIRDKLLNKS